MPVPKKKFREIVFQILYSYDLGQVEQDAIVDLIMKELAVTRKTVKEAEERAKQIIAIQEETDTMIAHTSISYEFSRIQTVERNILRLGIYELFFDDSIPPKVAITEAMRLARKFGSPESANYVNAILDTLYKASQGQDVDIDNLTESTKRMKEIEEVSKEAAEKMEKTMDDEDEEDNENDEL